MGARTEGKLARRIGELLLLLGATLGTYLPVWHAGFVWDDDAHLIRPALRAWHGLARIWSEPGATQQYYPVLYSAFWGEHHLWGDNPLGYHLLNVGLHASAAFMLGCVLRRLGVRGAGIAAAIFALHPVAAESVAWVSEQKNTLSAVLYLGAALAWLRFERGRSWVGYAAATACFLAALLTKSVTATLPAALLVVLWWRDRKLNWRRSVLPLVPWFGAAAAMGAVTAWVERVYVGASGSPYALDVSQRFALAGRIVWFYLAKDFWPADLTFIYPKWGSLPLGYAVAAAAALATVGVVARRSGRRGPAALTLLFTGALFPALGFIAVYPFLYSYVADHFQYLALMVFAAGAGAAAAALPTKLRWAVTTVVLAAAAAITFRQAEFYRGSETLWRETLRRNPGAWMAWNNLGTDLLAAGRPQEAMGAIQESLQLFPGNDAAHTNLADTLTRLGRTAEAKAEYHTALQLQPRNPVARTNYGNLLLHRGDVSGAIDQYRQAIAVRPEYALAHTNLGDAYLGRGQTREAASEYRRALELDPSDVSAETNLGTALLQLGQTAEAEACYRAAVALDPHFAIAILDLANVAFQRADFPQAIACYQRALEIDPNVPSGHNNLGFALLRTGRTAEAMHQFRAELARNPAAVGDTPGYRLLAAGNEPAALSAFRAAAGR